MMSIRAAKEGPRGVFGYSHVFSTFYMCDSGWLMRNVVWNMFRIMFA